MKSRHIYQENMPLLKPALKYDITYFVFIEKHRYFTVSVLFCFPDENSFLIILISAQIARWYDNSNIFVFVVQVFEVLLFYLNHTDHNVVTASLETLQQLLKTTPAPLLDILLTQGSIQKSSIFEKDLSPGMKSRTESMYFCR